jgi:hypothetical protein
MGRTPSDGKKWFVKGPEMKEKWKKKLVYLSPTHTRKLLKMRKTHRVSGSEVIRVALDRYFRDMDTPDTNESFRAEVDRQMSRIPNKK